MLLDTTKSGLDAFGTRWRSRKGHAQETEAEYAPNDNLLLSGQLEAVNGWQGDKQDDNVADNIDGRGKVPDGEGREAFIREVGDDGGDGHTGDREEHDLDQSPDHDQHHEPEGDPCDRNTAEDTAELEEK